MKKKKTVMLLFLFLSVGINGQNKSNLETINGLIDSSTINILKSMEDLSDSYILINNSPIEFAALNQHVKTAMVKSGINIQVGETGLDKINYSISNVNVNYSSLFRDGIFGDYLLERNTVISGEYLIQNSKTVSIANTFNYTLTDTIQYNNIGFVENNSLPFTKGNIPSAPLFPSILEPIIAVTSVAVTVILFFSVRSK